MKKLIITIILYVGIFSVQAQSLSPAIQTNLQNITDSLTNCGSIGVSTSVIIENQGKWNGASGYMDLAQTTLMDTTHYLEMGSITKVFTATMIMQLQQQGLLSLNDDIGSILPFLNTPQHPNISGSIKVHHLLNHKSGLNDYMNHSHYFDSLAVRFNSVQYPMQILEEFQPAPFLPAGIAEIYSNTNYLLLSEIIATVGGLNYGTMLQLNILDSLGSPSIVLEGSVPFPVGSSKAHGHFDMDGDNNIEDVYINYGDSRRIIELASGMEKMMASLAIRVALINVSTLSKTTTLMIDEGFGSLDATNLEACNRLLISLKKWFKNIIVISHVDVIKDCVDNTLDITKVGKDSHVRSE